MSNELLVNVESLKNMCVSRATGGFSEDTEYKRLRRRLLQHDSKDDLPKLYRKAAERLNLAPSQHTEQLFKQILGGRHAVVEGLGALRNQLSDAHGKGKTGVRPAPRHAELAVNLAGTVATFLIQTQEARQRK